MTHQGPWRVGGVAERIRCRADPGELINLRTADKLPVVGATV